MTKNRKRIFWPALTALLSLTALTFAASDRFRRSDTTDTKTTQTVVNPLRAKRGAYVRPGLLSPRLVWHLKALGDRLEKPGRERLSVTGTLVRAKDSQAEEVVALLEFPERIRLTIQRGLQARAITFDGEQTKSVGDPPDVAEQDLMETLVYGTAEHFFTTQMQGQATRFLGARFRMDDGSAADYSGPFYDVYKVADRIKSSADQREQQKLYYFNSETLLLERVHYQVNRDGSEVKVEEVIGNWAREQGQQVARRIERFENGKSVFVFTVRTAGLTPRADDGVFGN